MASPGGAGPTPPSHVPPPVAVPDAVMRAIYGDRAPGEKKAALEDSLRNWWTAYAERKDDEDEYVADTLLYDKTHLPRTAPAPDCVRRDRDQAASAEQPPHPQQQQQQQQQQQANANAAKLS